MMVLVMTNVKYFFHFCAFSYLCFFWRARVKLIDITLIMKPQDGSGLSYGVEEVWFQDPHGWTLAGARGHRVLHGEGGGQGGGQVRRRRDAFSHLPLRLWG